MRDILFKAKRVDNGEWVEGLTLQRSTSVDPQHKKYIFLTPNGYSFPLKVKLETICQYTGLTDKNGKKIWENDITKLVLPDGEVRYFKVSFKKVVRKVLCHPDFDDDVAKVELNAICFEWNGYELFPCVDENGVSDVSKMEVVGNIFENSELLEVKQ